MVNTVKGFCLVNEAKLDVFLEFSLEESFNFDYFITLEKLYLIRIHITLILPFFFSAWFTFSPFFLSNSVTFESLICDNVELCLSPVFWKTATVKKYSHPLCLEKNSFQRSIFLPLTKIRIPDGLSLFLTYDRDRQDPKIPIVCLIHD